MVGGIGSSGSSTSPYGLTALRGGTGARGNRAQESGTTGETGQALTPEQQQQVEKLKQVDASVRQHEAAHQAAGGSFAGGASFTYTRGPDGKNYATAGEVPIDISRESAPAATIAKMDQVKAAALAPADPSSQDARVAAQADALKIQAQQELRRSGGTSGSGTADSAQPNSADDQEAAAGDGGGSGGGSSSQPSAANSAGFGAPTDPARTARGLAAYGSAQGLGARTSQGFGLTV